MNSLNTDALDQLFYKARTHQAWTSEPVSDSTLIELYELMRWAPTSANGSPGRIVFVKTKEAIEKLCGCMPESNSKKVRQAPVTAIVAPELEFYEKLPKLSPHVDARSWFVGNQKLIETTAFRNGSLQGAYLMIAARALGLDVAPMSGFDNSKVDEIFLKGTQWKSNFICCLVHGDISKVYPRAPRLDFNEACKIV